jgi:hypothetical protein
MANKYKAIKTFRHDPAGKWYKPGDVVEFASNVAVSLLSARVIAPIIEAIVPKKPVVETADKKPAEENAVSAKIPRRGVRK